MKRKRLTGIRLARIATWTALATAWTTALLGRIVPPPAGAADPVNPPPPPQVEVAGATTTGPGVPALPDDGLVVIRSGSGLDPAPQQPVVRRVVKQVVQQPVVVSSGS